MKATFVKDIPRFADHVTQKLYRLDPPAKFDWSEDRLTEYVVASASQVPFSGPETYLFAADADGEIICWTEMSGSYKGGLNHEEAIRNAGYDIEGGE